MGERGQIPKRSDQLIRRNIPEVPVTKIEAAGQVRVPALGIKDPHPLVRDMYRAMKNSAQARYFEPSDWAYARLTLHFVDKLVKRENPSAMMLATANQMLTQLLLTEAERRRARLEIERKPTGTEIEDYETVADLYRSRLMS